MIYMLQRNLLDHAIVLNEPHLRRLIKDYPVYDHFTSRVPWTET